MSLHRGGHSFPAAWPPPRPPPHLHFPYYLRGSQPFTITILIHNCWFGYILAFPLGVPRGRGVPVKASFSGLINGFQRIAMITRCYESGFEQAQKAEKASRMTNDWRGQCHCTTCRGPSSLNKHRKPKEQINQSEEDRSGPTAVQDPSSSHFCHWLD